MIKYNEVKRIGLSIEHPIALAYQSGKLVIAYKNHIQAIDHRHGNVIKTAALAGTHIQEAPAHISML